MKIKKAFASILSLIMLLSVFSVFSVASSPLPPEIVLENAQAVPGDTVDVRVIMESNPGIINLCLNVEYDSSVLTLVNVTDTGLFPGAMHSPDYSRNPYYLTWNNDTAEENITVDGVFAVMSFKVAESAPEGVYELKLSYDENCDILNFDLNPVNIYLENGSIEIIKCQHENVEEVSGTAATCTADGVTGGLRCKDCGMWLTPQEYLPSLGHEWEDMPAKPATCTEEGLGKGVHCSRCGLIIMQQENILPLGHAWEDVPEKPATCTEKGFVSGVRCSRCGIWLTPQEEIPTKGHVPETVKGTAATCTAAGLTDGSRCSVCGKTLKAQTSIAALGHDMSVKKVIKAATVSEKGILRTSCSRCTYYVDSDIPKLPAPGATLGDVDNDNAITASDARLALRRAVKLETYAEGSAEFVACDVNKNGNVGADDARIILRIAVKLEKISDYNK